MSWGPIQPARIDFSDARAPLAPAAGDVHHARAGALAQAGHVFLGGNGLPGRWAGRERFVVLETGFGLGHNFLATWEAWRQDPLRCARLSFISLEKHPPQCADLARAHGASPLPALAAALVGQWPALTPDLHVIDFDAGRVRLLLALGDLAQVLPELVASVDAFYLDGYAPAHNPDLWDARRLRGLHRLAAPGATLATWSVAGSMREGLRAAGFEVHQAPGLAPGLAPDLAPDQTPGLTPRREMTVARFAPRVPAQPPPGRRPLAAVGAGSPQVAVIGAGLAGAAVARALAAQGLAVQVFDHRPGPAGETSGNAGGLFHGIVHGHDGPHARWLRAAALHTERALRPLIEAGAVPGTIAGLLRGEQALDAGAMAALLQRQALPAAYAQVRTAALPGGRPAWFYPGGGWVAPAALCAAWLAGDGIAPRYGCAVHLLQRQAGRWRLLAGDGRVLAEVDAVLLCNAADAARLAGGPDWPLQQRRGQTTVLPAGLPGAPRLPLPIADGGYALQLADGRLLCGGASQAEDRDPLQPDGVLREADHAAHLATLRRLTGWAADLPASALQGRVGWRLQADDRLPLLGGVPDGAAPPGNRRLDQPRLVPRQPGLYVFTALGSRGIPQAALGGEILAGWLTGAPMPAPAALLDALDPARFIARAVRAASG